MSRRWRRMVQNAPSMSESLNQRNGASLAMPAGRPPGMLGLRLETVRGVEQSGTTETMDRCEMAAFVAETVRHASYAFGSSASTGLSEAFIRERALDLWQARGDITVGQMRGLQREMRAAFANSQGLVAPIGTSEEKGNPWKTDSSMPLPGRSPMGQHAARRCAPSGRPRWG
jgi:hypothetical protein